MNWNRMKGMDNWNDLQIEMKGKKWFYCSVQIEFEWNQTDLHIGTEIQAEVQTRTESSRSWTHSFKNSWPRHWLSAIKRSHLKIKGINCSTDNMYDIVRIGHCLKYNTFVLVHEHASFFFFFVLFLSSNEVESIKYLMLWK